jgi:hypothetical protein
MIYVSLRDVADSIFLWITDDSIAQKRHTKQLHDTDYASLDTNANLDKWSESGRPSE